MTGKPEDSSPREVVRAKRLEIVDDEGQVRAVLGTREEAGFTCGNYLACKEVERKGEPDERHTHRPQRLGQPRGGATAHPTDSSTLFPCALCHNTTLQHYRLPNVTVTVTSKNFRNV